MQTRTKKLIGMIGATLGLAVFSMVALQMSRPAVDDIPLPFGGSTSELAGSVTQIGNKNGITVSKVLFPEGTNAEDLTGGALYLITVPDDASITDAPLDTAFTIGASNANVNYFGYKYLTADAATEKANKADALITNRFPGTFFASALAREEDAAHGGSIANFEATNSITMQETATLSGTLLQKNSLYLIVLNHTGSVNFRVRPEAVCGNGLVQSGEQCDDGNTAASDGCGATCQIESGYSCTGEPSSCTLDPVCGNGAIESGEECDDGNAADADGCSAVCAVESGYSCTGEPSSCSQIPPPVAPLKVGLFLGNTANTSPGATDLTFMRFALNTANDPVLVTSLKIVAETGALGLIEFPSLWRDTNHDGVVDTKVLDYSIAESTPTLLIFNDQTVAQDRVIASNDAVVFEIRGDITTGLQQSIDVQLGFKADLIDYVGGINQTTSQALSGIETDNSCTETSCDIEVTTVPSNFWHIIAP